jgi:hypothetical protein
VRIASPSLPSLRWAQVAVDLGRGRLVDLAGGPKVASSPWAPIFIARNALASGGIKALATVLGELAGKSPQLDPFVALARGHATAPALAAVASDPFRSYLAGMQARLEGNTALAVELLARALEAHGDACRAAGEYLGACRELGRAPDDTALAWLRRENAHCANLPELVSAKARSRTGPERISH